MTPTVTDGERRRRIAQRHGIAPDHRCADVVEATRAVTVLHATEPATVYLSLQVRVDGVALADIDHALYGERSLVKQLAMRRTLFVFPRDLLPAAWGSATARVRQAEDRRLVMEVERHGIAEHGPGWVAAARASAVAVLAAEPDGVTGLALRAAVPQLAEPAVAAAGTSWVASMLLTNLGLHLETVRGHNTQHWRLSRPRWTTPERWLGTVPEPLSSEAGYAVLVERWLRSFGPGTEDDIVWWLGATKGAVRRALADVRAVPVRLDDGTPAWLAADDPLLDSRPGAAPEPAPWAALLPVLDPTVMAWKGRGFYLGAHGPALFDRNGNAGTSAWWNGRIVGCWTQDDDGAVVVRPLEPLPAEAQRALRAEAARLGAWLEGQRVGTVYPSPAMRTPEEDLPYPVLRA